MKKEVLNNPNNLLASVLINSDYRVATVCSSLEKYLLSFGKSIPMRDV